MREFPKMIYKGGDARSDVYKIVADPDAQDAAAAEGFFEAGKGPKKDAGKPPADEKPKKDAGKPPADEKK